MVGLEYSQVGDKQLVDATFNHKVDKDTSVGSTVSYDLKQKRISTKTVIEKRVDADGTVIKGKVDNTGFFDVALTGTISPSLSATFSTGGNVSSIINGLAK